MRPGDDSPGSAIYPMQVVVNGEPRTIPEGTSIAGLLILLGVEGEQVAVELDRAIVRRGAWADREIAPGAQLEIVHFVGGG